jgi:diguanylate cyclase (GGDEF)-like protein
MNQVPSTNIIADPLRQSSDACRTTDRIIWDKLRESPSCLSATPATRPLEFPKPLFPSNIPCDRSLLSTAQQTITSRLQQVEADEPTLLLTIQDTLTCLVETLALSEVCFWQVLSDGRTFEKMSGVRTIENDVDVCPFRVVLDPSHPLCLATQNLWQIQSPANEVDEFTGIALLPSSPPSSQNHHLLLRVGVPKHLLGWLICSRSVPGWFSQDEQQFLQTVCHFLQTTMMHQRHQSLLQSHSQILEHLAAGEALSTVAQHLCLLVEQQCPGSVSALCFHPPSDRCQLDSRTVIAPRLPQGLVQNMAQINLVDALPLSATTEGGIRVIDLTTLPWNGDAGNEFLQHSLNCGWIIPVGSTCGNRLGTLLLFHPTVFQPSSHHRSVIHMIAHFAQLLLETEHTRQQLKQQQHYDALTHLPNRNYLMEQLQQRVALSSPFALLLLDVDHFKLVNDSLGYTVGDQLLVSIAVQLQRCIRAQDMLVRLGGDEFAILLDSVPTVGDAYRLSKQIQAVLSFPFNLNHNTLFTSVSIGIVHANERNVEADTLLRDAEIAMYEAKKQGRGCYAVFNKQMHLQTQSRLQLEVELRRAVDNLFDEHETQEFQLVYQPIVEMTTGIITGFEALLRWLHPTQGWIAPQTFIPVAEETGLIIPLGYWVLQTACQQLHHWQTTLKLKDRLTISVNVSGTQLNHPDFVAQVQSILQTTELSPQYLNLEITEHVLIQHLHEPATRLQQLQVLGVSISLDDFGIGFSSLSYLHHLPIQTLKIDRAFVEGLFEERNLCQTILALTQKLGMTAIAEGIESVDQLMALRTLGCQLGQGYLFSRPVRPDVAEWLLVTPPDWGRVVELALDPVPRCGYSIVPLDSFI